MNTCTATDRLWAWVLAVCVQEVLKAAADDKGEWYLPLDKEQVCAWLE
jgi:hypothetical protein